MENKLSSKNQECWYHEVCQMENPCSSCIRYAEMKFLMENSGLPKAKQKPIVLTPEDCDYNSFCQLQDIKNEIVDFVNNGNNLFIGGNTGNGKTSWAIKILLRYFDQIWNGNGFRVRGLFVHIPTILLELKDFNNPVSIEYRKNLLESDLVVWDEIGGIGMSNYDYSQLLAIIDKRVLEEKANIYTGNFSSEQESIKLLGERLSSRIWKLSQTIILNGKDRRGL